MQQTGTLRTWHDDKGFGFIAPTHGGRELFVHISAFPRDGTRPTIGESLTYELGESRDGKPQALRVVRKAIGVENRPAARPAARPAGPSLRQHRRTSRLGSWVAVLLVVVLAAHGFKHYQDHAHRLALLQAAPPPQAQPAVAVIPQRQSTSGLRCDGRTQCSQMASCQEATWFINHCPGMEMDGDHDGVPCEQQHCMGSLSK